jgi:acyl-ACP thioesterase
VLDPAILFPRGRTFAAGAGLADVDPHGRVRLDALARLLQDVAIDDVQETGWGTPSHLWFVRRIRIDVHEPFLQGQVKQ